MADLVMEVTDDKSLPKAERKRLQEAHAHHKTPAARLLKLADKISNLRDLAADPRVPAERCREYVAWARRWSRPAPGEPGAGGALRPGGERR
ncbi:MAG: hypothetical protein R3F43_27920 [bacterium]